MYCLCVSSRPGLTSVLTLQLSIWCEVLVFGGTRKESSVIFRHGVVHVPQDHALRRLSCPNQTFSPHLIGQDWLSFGALHSLPCIYVDVLCANTMGS